MIESNPSSMIYATLFIIILIVLAIIINKYLLVRQRFLVKGKYIGVLDRVILGKEKEIVLVEAGNKISMLGVTNQSINMICEINSSDLVEIKHEDGKTTMDFKSLFNKEFNRGENYKNK